MRYKHLKDYYGRDLRKLSYDEIKEAFYFFGSHPKKSQLSKLAWQNITSELERRRTICYE